MGDPKPVRGAAKRQWRRRRAGVKDAAYREFIHAQPCLVPGCRAPFVEMHHERSRSNDDADGVPLCTGHHRGENGRHGLRSLRLFEDKYGINVAAEIARLRGLYEAQV